MVYPGANHTRFEHAIGAVYLMHAAIDILRLKGQEISDEEADAVIVAILLHDIGHGPFSHVLESTLVQGVSHEQISLLLMQEMNRQFENKLELAIQIFTDHYHKHFLHQLVSSQLDMDRLDYLSRDSFFTGVSEGVISTERIIKMMDVANDQLVIEAKGIYSIEKFIIAHKIEKVKELIIYDELNLTEIAWNMHYSSVAHLSNQFKKITGLTPSHFKNLKDKRRKAIEDI